jgi:cardiolipin synthase A/B
MKLASRHALTTALRPNHQLTLLKSGQAFFAALVAAIAQAQSEVRLETYLFNFSRAPLAVAQALEHAAQRGVSVCVVMDGVGTGDVPHDWQQRWRAAGVQWHVFNPAHGWRLLLPKRWRRLHRKLCVVDGRVGFCGGINLLDDHFDPHHGLLREPRFDFSVQIQGALVADMHRTMAQLWARLQLASHPTGRGVVARVRALFTAVPAQPMRETKRSHRTRPMVGAWAALVLRDNLRFRRSIEHHYLRAILQAQHEVVIANAYFIPGVRLQRALLQAAARGVRITLLLQGKYEYFMQYHASRAVYGVLLAAGIQIVEYDASFLHAKVAVVDSEGGSPHTVMATVGSSNLDPLSLLLAREANLFVRDDVFAAELRTHLLAAITTHGHPVLATAHTGRPWLTRGLNWAAYGLMRVLVWVSGKQY